MIGKYYIKREQKVLIKNTANLTNNVWNRIKY